ncbi:tetratricopeptide repeat protein [Lentzea sp. E54]|uniref:tetratricopeptide repeat protein n=1 Tax=Lentzea xerophila TaxID=3435883 RepID=UPI003DA3286D
MWFARRKEKPVPEELARRTWSALALFDAGQYQHAEPEWRAIVREHTDQLGPDHPETIKNIDRLGSVLFRLRKLDLSRNMHDEAHRRALTTFGLNHPATLSIAHNLACAMVLMGDREAIPLLNDTLTRQRRKLGKRHQDTITTAKTLGVFLFTKGDAQGAITTLSEALQAGTRAFGKNDPLVADIAHQLDIVLRNSRLGR